MRRGLRPRPWAGWLLLAALAAMTCSNDERGAGATGAGGAAGAGGVAAEPPAGIEQGPLEFENFDRGVRCTLARNLMPRDADEAQAAVRWAVQLGLPIKAVSSSGSHSENDIICPDEAGVFISFAGMDRVLEIDEQAQTVRVEPGALMGSIGDALHARGLGLRNHIPFRDLTAAGVIATGAHHTSLRFPSTINDLVVGLELIDGRGERVSLTGAEARGASAHLGVLGAVVAVTFQAEPQYKLRARVSSGSDADLESRILDMAAAHDHASFSWFPSQSKYVLRETDRVPADTPGEAYSTNWHSTAQEQESLAQVAASINTNPDGRTQMCSVERIRAADTGLSHSESGEPVTAEEAVGWSHQMFSSVCTGLECPWSHQKIFNPEVAIDTRDLADWMRDIRSIVQETGACFPVNGLVIRFSKAGESWLGMNAGKDVAYVEFHIARHPDEESHEAAAEVHDEIHQLTLRKYAGRPHWGKNFSASFVGLSPDQRFEHWQDFLSLKQRLDPDGLFENGHWRRVIGAEGMDLGPGCAADRRCFCEENEHCANGRSCQPGVVFAEARVCQP